MPEGVPINGKVLAELRGLRCMTQDDLSNACEVAGWPVPRALISDYERAQKSPTPQNLDAIRKALSLTRPEMRALVRTPTLDAATSNGTTDEEDGAHRRAAGQVVALGGLGAALMALDALERIVQHGDRPVAQIILLAGGTAAPDPWVADLIGMAQDIDAALSEHVATVDAGGGALPYLIRMGAKLLHESAAGENISTATWRTQREKDDMKRRQMLAALLGAAAGGLLPPENLAAPNRLGTPDVNQWQQTLNRLYELDDRYGGGGAVYELSIRSLRQLHYALQRSTYDSATGRELQSIAGTLTEHAGWLAFDAGRHADARYWWREALKTARLTENPELSTVVLASMSLQASKADRSREAVELAQAAQAAARPRTTPRLRSILLAREARGHARAGDASAARKAFHQATVQLDGERKDDDPPWLDFWGEADLACHEMMVAVGLHDLATAERAARAALASADEYAYPRNHALYLTELAGILLAKGDLDEALQVSAQAMIRGYDLDSNRFAARAYTLVEDFRRYDHQPLVKDFLDWASQMLAMTAGPQ